uniref:Small ribosomal subunit protein eS4 N-terminal domain-containing protein n=1 Tax=Equus asinus TaxID=9793 RepID=A0A9L0JNQ1_EQUAS
MAHGPKKHLKCIAAPKHWMLGKLICVFVPCPSTGPYKVRECLSLIFFVLRPGRKEVRKICMQQFFKIDGKVQTDTAYPDGFKDVISIDKTRETFCLIHDTKCCFAVHCIIPEEAKYKSCLTLVTCVW